MADQSSLFHIRDQRRQGWFSVDNEIVDNYASQIGAYGVAVYCVLCRHVRNENQQVKLSARDIGAALGISHDRVRKSLTDLANVDLIHHEVPDRRGPGLISTITLLDAKTTGRYTSSSVDELDATRPRNKEVKTNTETKTSPPFSTERDFVLKENAHAREARRAPTLDVPPAPPEQIYSQADFDARDLRLMADGYREVARRPDSLGRLSETEIFEWVCVEYAGYSVARGLEVQERGKKWPQAQTLEVPA